MEGNPKHKPSAKKSQREVSLERRLARSEAARKEAEQLLETKSRTLVAAQEMLRLKETELLKHVDRQMLSRVAAQKLAKVATFHGDEDQRFIGSENFADVVGSKIPVTSFEQTATMLHPLDREEAIAILMSAVEGKLIGKNVERDFRFVDDFGNTRWLRWAVTQSQSADELKFFGYGAVRDITEERQAERQKQLLLRLSERRAKQLQAISDDLQVAREEEKKKSNQLAQRVMEMEIMSAELDDARAEAEEADKSKSRFLAMMSHDIRTPMNAVLATLELLSISNLDAKQAKQVELARQSGDQLLFLLADIIEFARSDGWQTELQLSEASIATLIENSAATWQPLATQKKLQIEIEISETFPEFAVTDPTRIRQLVDNFVSNAIKYTSDGQILISADAKFEPRGCLFQLSVKDTGPGIAKELCEKLFEDFDRGDASTGKIEGTGLGLSICRRIADKMEGKIGVNSEVGEGSDFWVEIPVTVSDGSQIAEDQQEPSEHKIYSVDGRPPKILVAEDVETNQLVIEAMLESLGCEVIIVDDGSKVMHALEQNQCDGVLMDVWMPTNGLITTKQIRKSREFRKIPVFGVTAFAADEERSSILAAGMDGVIAKPINLAGLQYALENICDQDHQIGSTGIKAEAAIPEFGSVEYINIEKFREHFFAIPEPRQEALLKAVIADIEKWCSAFQKAWKDEDEKSVKASHHVLKGVCNGFGAYVLLEKLDAVHQTGQIGDADAVLPISKIMDYTISALRQSAASADRRRV